jgi:hypothetical protein
MSLCITPNCGRETRHGMGPQKRCHRCRQRARRRGDARQEPLRKSELAPYRDELKGLLKVCSNREAIEDAAKRTHESLLDIAQGTATSLAAGGVFKGPKWKRQAYDEITRVLAVVDPLNAAVTCGAMFMLRDRYPTRFVSQRAWLFEYVRSWRSLAPAAYSSWDDKRGCAKTYRRDLRGLAVDEIARLLIDAYAGFGSWAIAARQKETEKKRTLKEVLPSLS